MSVRALQARVECDRLTLEHLWRTHTIFHERLPLILGWLFKMRRGECGNTQSEKALYQRIGRFITSSPAQNADYLMNSISMKGWIPHTAKKLKIKEKHKDGKIVEVAGKDWADDAAALSAKGKLLFDKNDLSGDLPGCMRQMLNREAVAIISGHEQLVSNWKDEHQKWLDNKQEWEKKPENTRYLALRSKFDAFEAQVAGKVGKRRGRWHLYLKWLRENPDLAAWRGGPAVVNDLSPQAQERIRKAKPWKTRSVEAEEFWNANPELAALDKLHGYYEREFVRRRKRKHNPDGFDHRPTFTLPHPVNHPRWFVFNAPQTNPPGYRELHLPSGRKEMGSIQLQLLTGDKGNQAKYPAAWVPLKFRADLRMTLFRSVSVPTVVNRGKQKGQIKTKVAYEFYDQHLQRWRPAEISGVKLVFRNIRLNNDGSLRSAVPYLIFACTVTDLPLTDRAKDIQWIEAAETTNSGKNRKRRKLPEGIVTCAVDLGLRNVGFATLCKFEEQKVTVLRSRNIWLDPKRGGPHLTHIAKHKQEIKRLRRQRGKPVKGEKSHVQLQAHITHMGEDRFKKAARAILNFAWNVDGAHDKATGAPFPRADVIILEKLAGFIPDAERDRGVNRALAAWNRGQLVDRLKEMAVDAGYKGRVFEVRPTGTSQVCSKCGHLGRRYSISRDNDSHVPDIRFGWVESLFACPSCGYRANADHNASVNLHRRFLMGQAAVKSFFDWKDQSRENQQYVLNQIDAALRPILRKAHNLTKDLEVPF